MEVGFGQERTVAKAIWLTALFSMALTSGARAHEFWIVPDDFSPDVGASVRLRLFVGDGLEHGEPYARNPHHLKSFRVWQGNSRIPVMGLPGWDPAGIVRLREPGMAIVGYASVHSGITLDATKFEAYLVEEGLETITKMRAEAGESDRPGREVFRRCAKSLLIVGENRNTRGYDRRIGLDLELVPERNPFFLSEGAKLPVLLLYYGKPLVDAKVKVFQAGHPELRSFAFTDENGRVDLILPGHGLFMLVAVHMVPAVEDLDAEWESIWSSLTFEVLTAGVESQQDRTPATPVADQR
jgi:uncharacterized GH25 family protein